MTGCQLSMNITEQHPYQHFLHLLLLMMIGGVAEESVGMGMTAGEPGMAAGKPEMAAGKSGMAAGEPGMAAAGEPGTAAGELGTAAGESGMAAGELTGVDMTDDDLHFLASDLLVSLLKERI